MHARLDAWARVLKKRGRRSFWLTITAVGLLLFGAFWAVMGLLMALRIEEDDGVVIGMFCGGVLGVLPLIVGAVVAVLAFRTKLQTNAYEELVLLARHHGGAPLTTAEVARAMRVDGPTAEKLVVDLTTEGVLAESELASGSESEGRESPGRVSPFSPTVASPMPAGGAIATGAVLNGTWKVHGFLGAGGMGHVYAVEHVRTGRRYALKTLLPDARLSTDAIRRFEREAQAASALGHPGIVAVHDFDRTSDGLVYLVMDLLEGETLEERLRKRGSLSWDDARTLALQVADALAAAHAAGLLHRDVKPANVFLHRSGTEERAMLLDFGLAKPIEDVASSRITATGQAVGTPLYMSPEQARGEALDVRTDVYGLAATIYEMVTGAPPFLEPTPALAYARLLSEPALPASRAAVQAIPEALDRLLAAGLAKEPEGRPHTVAAFREALSVA